MPCLIACFLAITRSSAAIILSTSDSACAIRCCSSNDPGHATSIITKDRLSDQRKVVVIPGVVEARSFERERKELDIYCARPEHDVRAEHLVT